MTKITWGRLVEKLLGKIPGDIARKFLVWASLVRESGIREVRKCRGYHDESLKGDRKGQRSVRLNRAYRAIYIEMANGEIELIEFLEVNKHDY